MILEKKTFDEEVNALATALLGIKEQMKNLNEQKSQIETSLLALYGERTKASRTVHFRTDHYDIKIENGSTLKVDPEKLLGIIANGDDILKLHADRLFKYEPKVIKKEWDNADRLIQSLFADCITTKDSKPSINITEKENI